MEVSAAPLPVEGPGGRADMVNAVKEGRGSRLPVLKVLYLLAVTAAAFAVPQIAATRPARWYVVPGLLALQVVILLACSVGPGAALRLAWRLKWLFLFLGLCYGLLPAESHTTNELPYQCPVPGSPWTVPIHVAG